MPAMPATPETTYDPRRARRVLMLVSVGFFLTALDAHTGEPLEGFGGQIDIEGFPNTGVVDLLGPDGLGYEYDNPADGISLEQGYITSSSPALVVNGRWYTSPTMAGSRERAIQVLDYLIDKERRRR